MFFLNSKKVVGLIIINTLAFFAGSACAAGADGVWMDTKSSPGISRKGEPVSVYYSHKSGGNVIPANQAVTNVSVVIHATSGVSNVNTYVCDATESQCYRVTGDSLWTAAFKGASPTQSFILRHSISGKGTVVPPVFVNASVTVYYNDRK